jgi:hypothetical protein
VSAEGDIARWFLLSVASRPTDHVDVEGSPSWKLSGWRPQSKGLFASRDVTKHSVSKKSSFNFNHDYIDFLPENQRNSRDNY